MLYYDNPFDFQAKILSLPVDAVKIPKKWFQY